MEHRLEGQYWGPFAEMLTNGEVYVEEMRSTYDGPFAFLADIGFSEIADIDDYIALADRQRGAVLEVGCGSGRVLLRLAERGCEVTGVDCSEDMLEILRHRLRAMPAVTQERVTLVKADALELKLDREFALVIMPCCTFALFPDKEGRLAVLRRAARHLAVGGVFAFSYPVFDWDELKKVDGVIMRRQFEYEGRPASAQIGLRIMPQSRCILGNSYVEILQSGRDMRGYLASTRVTSVDAEELNALLRDAGLDIIQTAKSSLPQGMGERMTVTCTPRPVGNYPLWHPYQSKKQSHSDLLMLVEGKGCSVRDQHGTSYIDASAGLWNVQCGLGHSAIVAAIANQLERLSYGTLFAGRSNEPALELARELVSIAPAPLPWVYLTCSGSESVELAIKLARMYHQLRGDPQKREIVFLDQSYHGTYFGSMSVSGIYEQKERFAPTLPAVCPISTPNSDRRPAGITDVAFAVKCADELEQRIRATNGGVAAFLAEPVLGSAGVIVPPREYFVRIQDICRDHGVLFVVDEVATGFGRTGHWFASEFFGLKPDILLLSKGITSGYLPLGAVLFSAAVGQTLLHSGNDIGHGSTHNGSPACAAAALATIDVMRREALVERAADSGEYLHARMQELIRYKPVKTIRGLGLMLAIGLQQSDGAAATPSQVFTLKAILQQGRVLCYAGPSSLAFTPALVISKDEMDTIVDSLHSVLGALWLENGRVRSSGMA